MIEYEGACMSNACDGNACGDREEEQEEEQARTWHQRVLVPEYAMLYKKMMYMYQGSFINNTFYNIRNYINSEIIYMYLQVLVCSCCDLENRYIISAKKIENIQF